MTTTTTSAINNEENNIKNKIPTSSLSRLVIVNFYIEKWNVFIVPKPFSYYRDWKWFLRREAFLPPFPLTLLVPSNSTPNFSEELTSPPLLCEHSLGLHLTLCLFPSLSPGKRLWRDIRAAQQPTAQHRHRNPKYLRPCFVVRNTYSEAGSIFFHSIPLAKVRS